MMKKTIIVSLLLILFIMGGCADNNNTVNEIDFYLKKTKDLKFGDGERKGKTKEIKEYKYFINDFYELDFQQEFKSLFSGLILILGEEHQIRSIKPSKFETKIYPTFPFGKTGRFVNEYRGDGYFIFNNNLNELKKPYFEDVKIDAYYFSENQTWAYEKYAISGSYNNGVNVSSYTLLENFSFSYEKNNVKSIVNEINGHMIELTYSNNVVKEINYSFYNYSKIVNLSYIKDSNGMYTKKFKHSENQVTELLPNNEILRSYYNRGSQSNTGFSGKDYYLGYMIESAKYNKSGELIFSNRTSLENDICNIRTNYNEGVVKNQHLTVDFKTRKKKVENLDKNYNLISEEEINNIDIIDFISLSKLDKKKKIIFDEKEKRRYTILDTLPFGTRNLSVTPLSRIDIWTFNDFGEILIEEGFLRERPLYSPPLNLKGREFNSKKKYIDGKINEIEFYNLDESFVCKYKYHNSVNKYTERTLYDINDSILFHEQYIFNTIGENNIILKTEKSGYKILTMIEDNSIYYFDQNDKLFLKCKFENSERSIRTQYKITLFDSFENWIYQYSTADDELKTREISYHI